MTPPQLHMHLLELFSAGLLHISTVGDPGAQGAAHAGTHGIGVSTPIAAAVALATVGFARLLHIPNVMGGLGISIIVAAGMFESITVLWEVTVSGAGATPKVHWHIAVFTAGFAIYLSPFILSSPTSFFLPGNASAEA